MRLLSTIFFFKYCRTGRMNKFFLIIKRESVKLCKVLFPSSHAFLGFFFFIEFASDGTKGKRERATKGWTVILVLNVSKGRYKKLMNISCAVICFTRSFLSLSRFFVGFTYSKEKFHFPLCQIINDTHCTSVWRAVYTSK